MKEFCACGEEKIKVKGKWVCPLGEEIPESKNTYACVHGAGTAPCAICQTLEAQQLSNQGDGNHD